MRLVAELDSVIPLDEAAHWLEVAIEAVVENYGEYVDYNSITTQSDRGEMLYTLLDFLRLRASYERLAWNLRPVVLAHECWCAAAAPRRREIWRDAVAERTAPVADEHLKRFERLCKKYGMRLPSIAETPRRAIRSAVGDRSAVRAGSAGHRGASQRPRSGRAPTIGGADRPIHARTCRRRFRVAALARRPRTGIGSSRVGVGRRRRRTPRPERAALPGLAFRWAR